MNSLLVITSETERIYLTLVGISKGCRAYSTVTEYSVCINILQYLIYGWYGSFLTKHCFVLLLRDPRARLGAWVIDICGNKSTPLGYSQSGSGIAQLFADLVVYIGPHIVFTIYFISRKKLFINMHFCLLATCFLIISLILVCTYQVTGLICFISTGNI
jgi:hypothetical protein